MKVKKTNFYYFINSSLFFIAAYFIYVKYNIPFISGASDFSFIVADSRYYYEFMQSQEIVFIITQSITSWPILLLYFYFSNLNLILIINCLLLFYSLYKAFSSNRYFTIISILIFFNPIILSHVSIINKDIYGLISILFFISYYDSKKNKYLLYAIIFSVISRFSLTIVLMLFYFTKDLNFNKKFLFLVILFSILSYVAAFHINYDTSEIASLVSRDGSFGLVDKLNDLSSKGFYLIIYPLKTLLNFYSESINIFNPIGFPKFISFSSILYLIFSLIILRKTRVSIKNNLIYFIFIFTAIYSLIPFIQHRYFLPLYPLLIFTIFYKNYSYEN